MRQRDIPKDIESVAIGSGCPNNCWYCYEGTKVKFKGIPRFTKDKVKITDMNILSYPNPHKIISDLGLTKKYFELVSGIDFRYLDIPIACLLRKYRFGRFNRNGEWSRYIRFAWDFSYKLQYKMLDVFELLLSAGFKPNQIGIFVLVNGKVSYEECLMKLDTFKYWRCQIHDCCYDGGYPLNKKDFLTNPRFNDKRYWSYEQIKDFRRQCRKHNQKVKRKGIDAEYKGT